MGATRIPGRGFLTLAHKEWRDTRFLLMLLAIGFPILLDLIQRLYAEEIGYSMLGAWTGPGLLSLAGFILITEGFTRDESNGMGDTVAIAPVHKVTLLLVKATNVLVCLVLLGTWVVTVESIRRLVSDAAVPVAELAPVPAGIQFAWMSLLLTATLALIFRQGIAAIAVAAAISAGIVVIDHRIDERQLLGGLVTMVILANGWMLIACFVVVTVTTAIRVYQPGTKCTSLSKRIRSAVVVLFALGAPAMAFHPVRSQPYRWAGAVENFEADCPSPSGRYVIVSHQRAATNWIDWEREERLHYRGGVLDTWTHELTFFPSLMFPMHYGENGWLDDDEILLQQLGRRSGDETPYYLWSTSEQACVRTVPVEEADELLFRMKGRRWGYVSRAYSAPGVLVRPKLTSRLLDEAIYFPLGTEVALTPTPGVVLLLESESIYRVDVLQGTRSEVFPWFECSSELSVSPCGRWIMATGEDHRSHTILLMESGAELVRFEASNPRWSRIPGRILEWSVDRTSHRSDDVPWRSELYWMSSDGSVDQCTSPELAYKWIDDDRVLLHQRNDSHLVRTWNRHDGTIVTLMDSRELSIEGHGEYVGGSLRE